MAVPLNHKNHSQHKSGKSSVADFTSYYKSKGYKVVKDTFVLSPDGQILIKVNPKATGVLSIPNKVTTISYRAFSDCKLSAIVFPKSLQSIGEEPFTSCNVEILVFKSSPLIPQQLFSYWGPKEIIVDNKNDIERIKDSFRERPCRIIHKSDKWNYFRTTHFYSDYTKAYEDNYGVLYSKDGKILLHFNKRLHRYVIPEGVDTIAQGAFADSHIQEITLPKSMRVIGANAFSRCNHLKYVSFNSGLKHIFSNAFSDCEQIEDVNLPDSLCSIGGFSGCKSLISVKLPSKLTEIPDAAFSDTPITKIQIPDSVVSIGYSAFKSTRISEIIFPSSLKMLHGWGLANCENIKSVTLPYKVDSIPCEFFAGCKNLKSVIVEGELKEIERAAFKGCYSLEDVKIPDQEDICFDTFQDCKSLKSIRVPSAVRYIRHGAFAGCDNLESLEFFEGLEIIESNIVTSTRISEIVIPSTVRLIGGKAFAGAHYLTKVTFKGNVFDSLRSILNGNQFEDCPSLREIHIPKGSFGINSIHVKNTSIMVIED